MEIQVFGVNGEKAFDVGFEEEDEEDEEEEEKD